MPRHSRPWTPGEEKSLRWYADRGISLREAAKLLDRSIPSVLNKVVALRISFNGPSGAPFGNSNGAQHRYKDGHFPDRWLPKQAGELCRACGVRVADPVEHYREVHSSSRSMA
jgi:hypothetical protein